MYVKIDIKKNQKKKNNNKKELHFRSEYSFNKFRKE